MFNNKKSLVATNYNNPYAFNSQKGGNRMPVYVTMWKYTKDGLVDIRHTPERFKVVNEIIKSHGGKLVTAYGLIGEYDVMTIVDLPDEKALMSAILQICSKGRVIPVTMTAVPMDEFLKITGKTAQFVSESAC
jgi:uncharacterized protein with GYD domain